MFFVAVKIKQAQMKLKVTESSNQMRHDREIQLGEEKRRYEIRPLQSSEIRPEVISTIFFIEGFQT